ncbi:MAG: molecular chaperone HtpG [Gammaproteobacteria bacterium]|jgi:molecular chaperone HtpG|nr:molecular chaperone HtpG [Gammaproteobacteria bacterium]
MSVDTQKETLDFQTEVKQLLDIVIHSLYSNKEIFLRELISNASDAADKLRFEALANDDLYEGDTDLKIRVAFNKKARTVTVSDNGIGMSRLEVVDNIGTIAKSGTQEFLKALSGDQAKDAKLIGQFGVGFYSAFIVADRVTVETRRAGLGPGQGVRWDSEGKGEYSLETIEKAGRGTDVILHVRKGEDEFLDGFRLRSIIHKFSDHINLPITMKVEGKEEDETVNRASALWARPKKEIKQEEYEEFYKHVGHDFEAPLAYTHNRVEGKQEYISLLYVPARAPFDLWDRSQRRGIKLYVRRVFIMDDAEHLMPAYLRFVRGVIDSNDLPLNISREVLQRSKAIDQIRAASVKKVLGLLENLNKKDPEKYATFWKEFGKVLKEGVVEDPTNLERIAKLLRFSSTHTDSETQDVSLGDYVNRMKENQNKIYYVTADSFAAAKNSSHLEIFRDKGIEVLLLSDRVDEWLVMHLTEFDKKPLQSVAKGELDLGELETRTDKEQQEKAAKEHKEFVDRVKQALGDKIKDARVTHRLTTSPACLVADAQDMSANLERILTSVGQEVPLGKPILEINPGHPIVNHLMSQDDDARFKEWSHMLFDQALLSEGGELDDPAGFVHRLNELFLQLAGK